MAKMPDHITDEFVDEEDRGPTLKDLENADNYEDDYEEMEHDV